MDGKIKGEDILRLGADTFLRLGLGLMFLYSAWDKIQDPGLFQTTVDNYRMLPACVTAIFSVTMPMVELLVGLMFLITTWTREAAFATAAMLAMFIVALAQAQLRGLDISCGCFSESEGGRHDVKSALIRDMLLIVPTVWLLLIGQRRWIADFRLSRHAGSAQQSDNGMQPPPSGIQN